MALGFEPTDGPTDPPPNADVQSTFKEILPMALFVSLRDEDKCLNEPAFPVPIRSDIVDES